jgi:integrase
MQKNLTSKLLDSYTSFSGKRFTIKDEKLKGLIVRISIESISFAIRKKKNGKDYFVNIGRYPQTTISQARERGLQALSLIDQGINPNEKNQVNEITLVKVFKDYIESRGSNLKEGTVKGYKSSLNKYLADWANKPLSSITRNMVEERHRLISKTSPTRANAVMRQLRAYFNYAIGKYEDSFDKPIFADNPVKRLTHVKAWNREQRRQTVIKSYDLKKWFDAVIALPEHSSNIKTPNSSEICRDLFLFILFTGLRRREASTLRWEDIDFKDHSFSIENTKNHRTHALPLTPFLEEILERRKSDSPYVFHGVTEDKPINDPKKQLAKVKELSGLNINMHDLRRTFITIAESLDINHYALKRLINHKDDRDVTGGYIVTQVERLREPMNKITNRILELVK